MAARQNNGRSGSSMRLPVVQKDRLSRDSSCSSREEKKQRWTKRSRFSRRWVKRCTT
jgi:hypothetical protein